VRGLLHGQQLVQMPDGKLRIFTEQTGATADGAAKLATLQTGTQQQLIPKTSPSSTTTSPDSTTSYLPSQHSPEPLTVTAQLVQTPEGPRIIMEGLQGIQLEQHQLMTIQLSVKQELLKQQALARQQGRVPPTKISVPLPPEVQPIRMTESETVQPQQQQSEEFEQLSLVSQQLSTSPNNKAEAGQKVEMKEEDEVETKNFQKLEMKKDEVETKNFQKLEEQKVLLDKQIRSFEMSRNMNAIEYEDRKRRAQQENKIMDQDIEKAKYDLANKEIMRSNAASSQLLDSQQTDSRNNEIEEKIGSLKRKKIQIEKEIGDFPKKQKVNAGLVEYISNTIEEKNKDLECPVCFETAEAPIYQCTEGHLICKKCLPSLKICPECRAKYPKNPFRNRMAEKIVEEIKKLSMERKALLDRI